MEKKEQNVSPSQKEEVSESPSFSRSLSYEVPEEKPKTALDLPETDYFNPVVWQQMKGMAETFRASGALPQADNTAMVIMKLQAGREMDLKPIEAIKSFYFVNGSINIYGSALVRRFRKHGWKITYEESTDSCTAIVEKDGEKIQETFTFDEADASGWTKTKYGLKPGWTPGINRRLKLRYGALSIILKTQLPEILGSAVDVAEVAMDSTQVVAGSVEKESPQIEDGDKKATDTQLASIKALDKENRFFDDKGKIIEPMTKQDAVEAIVELTKGGLK